MIDKSKRSSTQKNGPGGVNSDRPKSRRSYGTLAVSSPKNPPLQKRKSDVKPQIIFNILSAVMPAEKAKLLAGYSGKTNPDKLKGYGETVQGIREKLQNIAGVTLADQVAWFVKAAGDAEGATSDQIAARREVNKMLGYDAPQKVEVNERREIFTAVQIFQNFSKETGMNPRQLFTALKNAKQAQITSGVEVTEPGALNLSTSGSDHPA